MPNNLPTLPERVQDALRTLDAHAAADAGGATPFRPYGLTRESYAAAPAVDVRRGNFGKKCESTWTIDAAGVGRTRASGTVNVSLNAYRCIVLRDPIGDPGPGYPDYDLPVNVEITARGTVPAIFAATTSIAAATSTSPEDLVITVSAWDVNGNPLADQAFYWRCWTATTYVVDLPPDILASA